MPEGNNFSPLSLIPFVGSGLGLLASGIQYLSANRQRKRAEKDALRSLNAMPDYRITESTRNMLADALASRQAINPATQMAYQQAQQQAANQMAQAQRNAASGSEALAAGSAAQSNLQSIVPTLAQQQTQFNQANRGAYYDALNRMAGEEQTKQDWARQKNQDMFNYFLGRAGAATARPTAAGPRLPR